MALACLTLACSEEAEPGGSSSMEDASAALDAGTDARAHSVRDATATKDPIDAEPDATMAPRDAALASVDADTRDATIPTVPAACTVSASEARCASASIERIGSDNDVRRVYWNRPTTPAPTAGYPAVIVYQGSFYGPATSWDVGLTPATPFGGYHQVVVVAKLIEAGFVVIQPEARGGLFWSTNQPGDYATSADGVFIPLLLDAVADGHFGAIDLSRLYATGISSGGYMTSRMAVTYPGRFRALAIQSGSYATCLGPLCNVPDRLPADHPPTLLLHGALDATVSISTARTYETKLKANAIEVEFVEDPRAGHEWLSTAPDAVVRWFAMH